MKNKIQLSDILINTFLMILLIMTFIPFYHVFIVSFASPEEILKQSYYLIPTTFNLSSYRMIWDYCRVDIAIGNSLFVTVIGTFLSMLVTSCAAYALSKKSIPGRRVIMAAILFTMLFSGGLVPFYLTIKNIGLVGSRFVMIFPTLVNTFYLIVMLNYFRTIPAGIEESAKIDGANDITILFRIVLPVSLPTMAAVTLFYSVDKWNEWWNAQLFISDQTKFPLQLFLRQMMFDYIRLVRDSQGINFMTKNVFPDGLKTATIVVTILPIMFVYPFVQKYFASGVMLGAIKE